MKHLKKRAFLAYIFANILIFQHSCFAVGIEEVRDTYALLAQPYRHLSVLHGAISWESGLIRNYHDFGNIAIKIKGKWLPDGDGPTRLTHALFSLINGNFTPSTNSSYPATHLQPSTIALILAYLEKTHTLPNPTDALTLEKKIIHEPAFKKSIETTEHKKKLLNKTYQTEIKQIKARLKTPSSSDEKEILHRQLKQLTDERTKIISKHDTQRLFKALYIQHEKTDLAQRLSHLEIVTGREKSKSQKEIHRIKTRIEALEHVKADGDCNRVHELAQALLDAHADSFYYPQYSAHAILLAFLYKKAQTKKDLIDYYNILHNLLGPEIFADYPFDTTRWLESRYSSSELPALQEILKKQHEKNPDAFLLKLFDHYYEDCAYTQITTCYYRNALPKKAEYSNVECAGQLYPDCMETTLRNICNIQLYDHGTGTFDLQKAPTRTIDPAFKAFYTHDVYKQATAVEHKDVYQHWADLLINKPWITYRSMLYYSDMHQPLVITAPDDTDGFVRMPQHLENACNKNHDKITIAGRKYIAVNRDDVSLFEIIPTIRNIIITLNHLFGLNLYKDERDLLNKSFDETYFPRLCRCIKPLQSLRLNQINRPNPDSRDYLTGGLHIPGKKCELILLKNHAEFSMQQEKSSFLHLAPFILDQLAKTDDTTMRTQLMHAFPLFPCSPDQIPPKLRPYLMFALDVQNHDEKLVVLKQFLQPTALTQLSPDLKERMISFAAKLMASLPTRLDWIYQIRFVNAVDPRYYVHPKIAHVMQTWRNIVYNRLDDETAEPDSAPDYFTALAWRGQAHYEGIALARICMHHIAPKIQDVELQWRVKESALKLYLALALQQNNAQSETLRQEALQAAQLLPDAPISAEIQLRLNHC